MARTGKDRKTNREQVEAGRSGLLRAISAVQRDCLPGGGRKPDHPPAGPASVCGSLPQQRGWTSSCGAVPAHFHWSILAHSELLVPSVYFDQGSLFRWIGLTPFCFFPPRLSTPSTVWPLLHTDPKFLPKFLLCGQVALSRYASPSSRFRSYSCMEYPERESEKAGSPRLSSAIII